MKKLFLFSTKLYYFWTVIPLAFILAVAIYLNNDVKTVFKLYPMIILLSVVIIVNILFYIRGIRLTYDDARCLGLFSKKDYARYSKDSSLVITVLRHGRLLVEVFGFIEEGGIGYDWFDSDKSAEINLFRARTNGNSKTVKKILRYYGASETDAQLALNQAEFKTETKEIIISSTLTENDSARQVRITFKEIVTDAADSEDDNITIQEPSSYQQ